MSSTIIVSWENSPETSFPVQGRVFDLVCMTVGKAARSEEQMEVAKLCDWAVKDRNLLLVSASSEAKAAFGRLLREALNNGTIIREMLSWPTPLFDSSLLLPENRTPEVISFICNAAALQGLRRLTIYLDRYIEQPTEGTEPKPTS